jgi:hypothetical protein
VVSRPTIRHASFTLPLSSSIGAYLLHRSLFSGNACLGRGYHYGLWSLPCPHRACPCLVIPWTLIVFHLPAPHAQFLLLRHFLRLPVCLFKFPKFSTHLCLVDSSQSGLEHLLPDISLEEKPAHPNCGHYTFVLISFVDIGSHPPIHDVAFQPFEGFGGVRLGRLAKVCCLWRIDSCYPNMYLCIISAPVGGYKESM